MNRERNSLTNTLGVGSTLDPVHGYKHDHRGLTPDDYHRARLAAAKRADGDPAVLRGLLDALGLWPGQERYLPVATARLKPTDGLDDES